MFAPSRVLPLFVSLSLVVPALLGQDGAGTAALKYQLPPDVMVKMVDAPLTPTISLSPAHGTGPRMILIQQSSSLPTIADLAEPELRLAGIRFNPKIDAPSRTRYAISLKLQPLVAAGGTSAPVAMPIAGCLRSRASCTPGGLRTASTSPW